MSITERFRRAADEHPLGTILAIAAVARLFAVIFARGFMASDDYFVYLHVPWLWTRGIPYWFDMDHPSGFSIVYPGINYLIMVGSKAVGLTSPEGIMYIDRAIHAAWSLLGVALAYKLTELISEDRPTAFTAGLLAALFSFLPYGSVRNLPEMVCVPFVMAYLLTAERATRENGLRDAFLSGIAIGAAFVFRFQALAFGFGAGSVFLFRRQWKLLFLFAAGALLPALFQGTVDLIAYGKFFGTPLQYFFYNVEHSTEYVVGPWYRYLLLIAGLFIPPFSLLFLPGIFGARKIAPVTLVSTLIFIVVHSAVPAKQERFIIPAVLPLIVLGTAGLAAWMRSPRAARFRTPVRWLWRWFWAWNAVLLVLFTLHYGKRGQIEALDDLRNRGDVRYLVVDRTDRGAWLPLFYLGLGEDRCYWISDQNDWAQLDSVAAIDSLRPNYAFVNVPRDIHEHMRTLRKHGFGSEIIAHYGPAPLEWLLAKANPRFNSTNEVWLLRLLYPPQTEPTEPRGR